jgi:phospholipase/lecithinase/hemolysin
MDPHVRLTRAAQLLTEYKRMEKRLESQKQILKTAQENQKMLEKKMLSEGKDLEKLDGISLLNLWHSIRASKDLAREKEMQEYLAAKMKYEEATVTVQQLEADIRSIENKLQSVENPVQEYQEALKAKENYLLKSGNTTIQRIFDLDEKLGRLQAEKQELLEARAAGQSAGSGLARVADILNSASGWGALDIVGGGLLITAIKHSRINDANRELKKTQALLQRFQRELEDVNLNDTIGISKLSIAADFLLDGLLFDLIAQSQINNAKERVRKAADKVEQINKNLEDLLAQNQQQIEALVVNRNKIIEEG